MRGGPSSPTQPDDDVDIYDSDDYGILGVICKFDNTIPRATGLTVPPYNRTPL